jgi:hypothetical protein
VDGRRGRRLSGWWRARMAARPHPRGGWRRAPGLRGFGRRPRAGARPLPPGAGAQASGIWDGWRDGGWGVVGRWGPGEGGRGGPHQRGWGGPTQRAHARIRRSRGPQVGRWGPGGRRGTGTVRAPRASRSGLVPSRRRAWPPSARAAGAGALLNFCGAERAWRRGAARALRGAAARSSRAHSHPAHSARRARARPRPDRAAGGPLVPPGRVLGPPPPSFTRARGAGRGRGGPAVRW